MNWQLLTNIVRVGEVMILLIIIVFFLPALWIDMKEMWRVLVKKENSAEATAEHLHEKVL